MAKSRVKPYKQQSAAASSSNLGAAVDSIPVSIRYNLFFVIISFIGDALTVRRRESGSNDARLTVFRDRDRTGNHRFPILLPSDLVGMFVDLFVGHGVSYRITLDLIRLTIRFTLPRPTDSVPILIGAVYGDLHHAV